MAPLSGLQGGKARLHAKDVVAHATDERKEAEAEFKAIDVQLRAARANTEQWGSESSERDHIRMNITSLESKNKIENDNSDGDTPIARPKSSRVSNISKGISTLDGFPSFNKLTVPNPYVPAQSVDKDEGISNKSDNNSMPLGMNLEAGSGRERTRNPFTGPDISFSRRGYVMRGKVNLQKQPPIIEGSLTSPTRIHRFKDWSTMWREILMFFTTHVSDLLFKGLDILSFLWTSFWPVLSFFLGPILLLYLIVYVLILFFPSAHLPLAYTYSVAKGVFGGVSILSDATAALGAWVNTAFDGVLATNISMSVFPSILTSTLPVLACKAGIGFCPQSKPFPQHIRSDRPLFEEMPRIQNAFKDVLEGSIDSSLVPWMLEQSIKPMQILRREALTSSLEHHKDVVEALDIYLDMVPDVAQDVRQFFYDFLAFGMQITSVNKWTLDALTVEKNRREALSAFARLFDTGQAAKLADVWARWIHRLEFKIDKLLATTPHEELSKLRALLSLAADVAAVEQQKQQLEEVEIQEAEASKWKVFRIFEPQTQIVGEAQLLLSKQFIDSVVRADDVMIRAISNLKMMRAALHVVRKQLQETATFDLEYNPLELQIKHLMISHLQIEKTMQRLEHRMDNNMKAARNPQETKVGLMFTFDEI